VQRAVAVLGGELVVDTQPGRGTTVRVSLPNALDALPQAAARS
jgi:chemotaxis protein histidine kinase CheA